MRRSKRLSRKISYFGSKWRSAPKYPEPKHDTIVEPFAGGAGYSLLYPDRDVILVEKFEKVAAVWEYLIAANGRDILSLPLLDPGQSVNDFESLSDAERWLIGWWVNASPAKPCSTLCSWAVERGNSVSFWSEKCRARLASEVEYISHWQIIHGSYEDAPDIEATWFVDPPYQEHGIHYPEGSDQIDFDRLGAWCKSRRGQVIVCENAGADWLPFQPLYEGAGKIWKSGKSRKNKEVVFHR